MKHSYGPLCVSAGCYLGLHARLWLFLWLGMSQLKVCCHPVFSRSSVSVGVGVRDVEAVISGLSPWVNLWQRDSTVQVRSAKNTESQTHNLYPTARQQNRTKCTRTYLGREPSVSRSTWLSKALEVDTPIQWKTHRFQQHYKLQLHWLSFKKTKKNKRVLKIKTMFQSRVLNQF